MFAETEFAFTLQDEEPLLLAVVAMERALDLARRQDCEVLAKISGADVVAYRRAAGRVDTVFLDVVERDLVQVHDWLDHSPLPIIGAEPCCIAC